MVVPGDYHSAASARTLPASPTFACARLLTAEGYIDATGVDGLIPLTAPDRRSSRPSMFDQAIAKYGYSTTITGKPDHAGGIVPIGARTFLPGVT